MLIRWCTRVGFESHEARAIRRTNSMTDAAYRKARADWIVASKYFASRRLRPIQAKNRSTTQRRGLIAKPIWSAFLRTISTAINVH